VAQAALSHPTAALPSAPDTGREAADRLRAVQAEVARARASLEAARREEAAVLAELHAAGRTWFKIASYAPIDQRRREAQRLRTLVHRYRRVTGRNGILGQGQEKPGGSMSAASPSTCSTTTKEILTMPTPRLIKRTVTEEIFDDHACPASDLDDDDDDAIADDDDLEDAIEPVRASRSKSQESANASGAETVGADSSDLTGEEDE
jgi:hypothetical protein